MHILWNPEMGHCQQCGIIHENIRKFTAYGHCTNFCVHCWNGFVSDECNVLHGYWKQEISDSWNEKIILRLEYEDGTSGAQFWH